jgi:hypothetical protein
MCLHFEIVFTTQVEHEVLKYLDYAAHVQAVFVVLKEVERLRGVYTMTIARLSRLSLAVRNVYLHNQCRSSFKLVHDSRS